MKSPRLLLAFCAFPLCLSAAPLVFPAKNFAVEIPPSWTPINPLPSVPPGGPMLLVASQSADKKRTVLVFTENTLGRDRAVVVAGIREGLKRACTAKGWTVDAEHESTIGGLPFVSFTSHTTSGGSLTAFTTSAGDEAYVIQYVLTGGSASSDPDLQSIVQSFRLLTPPRGLPLATSSKSPAFQAGERIGRIVGWVLVIALIAGGLRWLVSRRRQK